jgi:hypothetical protein
MKKIETLISKLSILTTSQMMHIKGGAIPCGNTSDDLSGPNVGPVYATNDEKRRDRPGGGVSTH